MVASGFQIKSPDLKDLVRDFRFIDTEIPKVFKQGSLAAAKVIADEAADRMSRTPLGAAVVGRGGLKPAGQQRHAVIKLGGARGVLQAAAALEFGAKRDRYNFYGSHGWQGNQYQAGFGDPVKGHYIGQAAKTKAPEALEAWEKALEDVLRSSWGSTSALLLGDAGIGTGFRDFSSRF